MEFVLALYGKAGGEILFCQNSSVRPSCHVDYSNLVHEQRDIRQQTLHGLLNTQSSIVETGSDQRTESTTTTKDDASPRILAVPVICHGKAAVATGGRGEWADVELLAERGPNRATDLWQQHFSLNSICLDVPVDKPTALLWR